MQRMGMMCLTWACFVLFRTPIRALAIKPDRSKTRAGLRLAEEPAEPQRSLLLLETDDGSSWRRRADEVRDATKFVWSGYKSKAWGHDAISPASGRPSDWCGAGVFILDGLTTLQLAGLEEELKDARAFVKDKIVPKTMGHRGPQSLFETNIRALGGLLGAHALSDDPVYLNAAVHLGNSMVGALQTESSLPDSQVDVGTGSHLMDGTSLADAGTLLMEFVTLSHVSGDPKFEAAVYRTQRSVMKAAERQGYRGLLPNDVRSEGSEIVLSGDMSMGARGDSYYEYLLKHYLLTGRREDRLLHAWQASMNEMMHKMVTKTKSGMTFIADIDSDGEKQMRMQHLTCFVPGMLMLGRTMLPEHEVNPEWEQVALDVAETCWQMYERQPTGLAPEFVEFDVLTDNPEQEMRVGSAENMLRPEAAESNYYLWRFTGNPKYRQRNWKMFEAFKTHSKSKFGYESQADVTDDHSVGEDTQESFFLAETLKYLFLSFADPETLDLNSFVLNTEAHPLRVFNHEAKLA